MFPPMVNTLFLEKQIENDMKVNVSGGSPLKETLAHKAAHTLEFHSAIEEEMKQKLIQIFNNASSFFWYPPEDLLNERYVQGRT